MNVTPVMTSTRIVLVGSQICGIWRSNGKHKHNVTLQLMKVTVLSSCHIVTTSMRLLLKLLPFHCDIEHIWWLHYVAIQNRVDDYIILRSRTQLIVLLLCITFRCRS